MWGINATDPPTITHHELSLMVVQHIPMLKPAMPLAYSWSYSCSQWGNFLPWGPQCETILRIFEYFWSLKTIVVVFFQSQKPSCLCLPKAWYYWHYVTWQMEGAMSTNLFSPSCLSLTSMFEEYCKKKKEKKKRASLWACEAMFASLISCSHQS